MIAKDLYNKLEIDFKLAQCTDDWSEMTMNDYITQNFKERYMGLVTDNTDEINYVYTAVFPSPRIIEKIILDDKRDALLFVHHPMWWDINKTPAFIDIRLSEFQLLKERGISIYNLHTPLDANGRYGTSYNLSEILGVQRTGEFCEHNGVKVGILGTIKYDTIDQLRTRCVNAFGHKTALYQYGGKGNKNIKGHRIALVAGGGNDAEIYPFLQSLKINAYVTGIARLSSASYTIEAHESAKECNVNIIAGTHYSTEKFACKKMVEYFKKLELPGEFIPDEPCLEDM